MRWRSLKARLLAKGTARVTGQPVDAFVGKSTAGPSAGGGGSVFFAVGARRVRLAIDPCSTIEIHHAGHGSAILRMDNEEIHGVLEPVGLHCPRQAYITISEACIFRCRYCRVPSQKGRTKTPAEVRELVAGVRERIDAICLTGGVADSLEAEEQRACTMVQELSDEKVPVGVSIYPGLETPERLLAQGVAEVKFNVETATELLFRRMCPDLDRGALERALARSVELFGEGRVFSNLIVGLGETDAEIEACVDRLAEAGVIPVLRPLTPAVDVAGFSRPPPERLLHLLDVHERALKKSGLSTRRARTMCTLCTGCDLVPGRDT